MCAKRSLLFRIGWAVEGVIKKTCVLPLTLCDDENAETMGSYFMDTCPDNRGGRNKGIVSELGWESPHFLVEAPCISIASATSFLNRSHNSYQISWRRNIFRIPIYGMEVSDFNQWNSYSLVFDFVEICLERMRETYGKHSN